jgi:WD40 repeat protein
VWDLESGRLLRSLESHATSSFVTAVAVTSDGQQVVSALYNQSLKVWDLESGRLLRSLEGHTSEVTAVAVAPGGWQVVSGSEDNTIRLWNLSEAASQVLFWNDAPIHCLALSRDGPYLCCGDGAGRVWIFEWVGAKEMLSYEPPLRKSLNVAKAAEVAKTAKEQKNTSQPASSVETANGIMEKVLTGFILLTVILDLIGIPSGIGLSQHSWSFFWIGLACTLSGLVLYWVSLFRRKTVLGIGMALVFGIGWGITGWMAGQAASFRPLLPGTVGLIIGLIIHLAFLLGFVYPYKRQS